jgi:hypothetical protein
MAQRISTELILELRYMIRFLVLAFDELALLLEDNMSVVLNTLVPSHFLKNKYNAIAYHRVRGSIAARIMSFWYMKSEKSISDALTKPLNDEKFHYLMTRWLLCARDR